MFERIKWALLIGVLGYMAFQYIGGGNGGPPVGEDAPSFTVPTMGGEPFVLADHRGKVIVLDFWASWCPPCKASLPALQKVYEAHKDDEGVLVVSVNTDQAAVQDGRLAQFVKQRRFTFPVLFDRGMRISKTYAVQSIPTMVVVAADGRVHHVQVGLPSNSVAGIAAHLEAQIASAQAAPGS
jgi:thiol-disulfide isomerase/thioredoxin